jgi:hypothetical protein
MVQMEYHISKDSLFAILALVGLVFILATGDARIRPQKNIRRYTND